ncbi:restriction endonuclease [Litchfieldia salsa]|uniref:Restriction system protein n=1 Tax=Litchfieldia salsa TaxID=930152 RepID=A0A1H0VP10_9BACI|nr:restriction endonuclease [Litchfieldia salsa]SDP80349.1 restriction system protein [Litchfieldia salsa]
MNKRDRENLLSIINGLIIIIGLVIVFKLDLSFYWLVGVIIGGTLFSYQIIGRMIPIKNTKKKKTQSKTLKTASKSSKNETKKMLSEIDLLTAKIESLSGEEFERLVYLYFKDKGFKPETTAKTGDHGVDLVIKDPKDGLKIAVQCKRYKENIGNKDLIKLEGGKRFYKCPGTMFITTSNYTAKAMEFAESVNMELWNGLHIQDKIGNWRNEEAKKSKLIL